MKIKTVEVDGKTYAEIQDGKPVYVKEDGAEEAFDAAGMYETIKRLNHEAMTRREAQEALEAQVSEFGGLDASKAKEALRKLQAIDDKKLIDAGEAERLRDEIAESYKAELEKAQGHAKQLEQKFSQQKIDSAFNGSKFVQERLAIPADMVKSAFGNHFKVDDGNIVPLDANGNTIFSPGNPGQTASFDEALEQIVAQYPHRDSIMKGSGQNGSGAAPVNGDARRSMSRKEFDQLSPEAKRQAATEVQVRD